MSDIGDETLEDVKTRAPSFYHVIIHLLEEIDERRASMPDFDARLTSCKQALLHKGSGAQNDEWARHEERLRARPAMNMDEFDMDAEFLRNVVVLEEFIKELLAAIVTRGSVEYDHMAYL
ncbi:hypothetical protein HK105_203200 [Polyrhizophydium stewartii]|uniref:Uncharacterized protein n=1 Tax=Polyrhizophydium stewartii TaxID=2732419 RepID=A0ABR4NCB7_9FUNG